eukprot:SAG31_NODE_860_length_11431_cov_8.068920_12_plen_67_part_00
MHKLQNMLLCIGVALIRALKRLHKRVNGDVELVAQFVSETMDRLSNDRVRWTRALDSKLRTACAGV